MPTGAITSRLASAGTAAAASLVAGGAQGRGVSRARRGERSSRQRDGHGQVPDRLGNVHVESQRRGVRETGRARCPRSGQEGSLQEDRRRRGAGSAHRAQAPSEDAQVSRREQGRRLGMGLRRLRDRHGPR